MKKHLLLLGLAFTISQPTFSQSGCPLGGCPAQAQPQRQAVQPRQMTQPMTQQRYYQQPGQQQQMTYQAPVYQQAMPVYQQPLQMPVYQAYQPVNPCCPQRAFFMGANPQCFTGAAAPICKQPRSGWRVFVEDYLGFD